MSTTTTTTKESFTMRNYHSIQLRLHPTGDAFRVDGTKVPLPFSAAAQTDQALIPSSYHVAGMVAQHLAAAGTRTTSKMILEIQDATARYQRDYYNNPSAAKGSSGDWMRA